MYLPHSVTNPYTCGFTPARSVGTVVPMTNWQTRKAVGDALEQRVAEELTLRGWSVSPWGQAILDEHTRSVLRRTDSALRWTPDLSVTRGEITVMVDCKASMTSAVSDRHAVERAAVKSHLQFTAFNDIPVYYVFDNLGVLSPHDVMLAGRIGPHTKVGSGAPYYLIGTGHDRPFDDVFGPHEALLAMPARSLTQYRNAA